MNTENKKKFFIVDGSALAYRSYFAFIKNPLINSKGVNTSAVYGFTSALLRIIKNEDPTSLVVVFDSPEPTFRHQAFPAYKATREKMPEELVNQLPLIEKTAETLGIPVIKKSGFEADDIMGALALKAAKHGYTVYLVTGDKDFMQLVDDARIMMYSLKKKGDEHEILDRNGVINKLGVPPEKVVEVMGLMGDSSDNIPGVPGVGPKTAVDLINKYGSIEGVYEHLDEISKKALKEKLKKHKDDVLISRRLAMIATDLPIDDIKLESLKRAEPDNVKILDLFRELEFESLIPMAIKPEDKSANTDNTYTLIDTQTGFEELLKKIEKAKEICIDTETTGLDPFNDKLLGIAVSIRPSEGYFIYFSESLTPSNVLPSLAKAVEKSGALPGGHNIKFDLNFLSAAGMTLDKIGFDSMIEAYLLEPGARRHGLDAMSIKILGHSTTTMEDLVGKGKKQIPLQSVSPEDLCNYAAEDAAVSLALHKKLEPKIKEEGLGKIYREIELPLVPVLSRMEMRGIKLDTKKLADLSKEMEKRLAELEKEIHTIAKEPFNINSPKQLGEILFEKLQVHKELGIKRVKRTKTGYATGVEVLETLRAHPIADKILEYRNLSKLKSTYLDALPALVNPATGKIHTSFNQTVTATGRLSSSNPNLQNIPIRTELGRKIRSAFIPSENGWQIISADYSQIELRVLAHMAEEKALTEAFLNGEDIHAKSAAVLFGKTIDNVTPEDRDRVKAFNYGIIYGMGPQRLARETGLTTAEASEFIEAYFDKFPGIKKFIEEQHAKAETNGFVTTLFGRKRWIPEITSSNPMLRAAGRNMAVNTPIQGTAADLIKMAMIKIDKILTQEGLKARMLIQVHDELVFEAPKKEMKYIINLVKKEMEGVYKLKVPLEVRIGCGENWLKAH